MRYSPASKYEIIRTVEEAEQHPVELRKRMGRSLIEVLGCIHGVDVDAVGLGNLGRREGYIERQLRRWDRQFRESATREVPHVLEVHDTLASRVPEQQGVGIVHGDYRLDNLFFRRHEDGPEVIAIDWQICVRTVGAYDLGYFLSQSLTIEDRRTHEERLLDVYRSTLAEADIDSPADELLEDYRRTVLFCLCYPIQAGGNIELVNDRAVQLVGLMLDRVVAAIRDLDAASLMP